VKQLAQYQDGRLELQEVPCPTPPPGGVLVRTTHSVISIGTEKMKLEQARMNLLQKARARPDQVRKVMETARNLGWRSAMEKVRNRLETPTPLGYSAAGIVTAVHPTNTRFRVGDRVACGGAECAFHAEYIAVPDLLTAPIPHGVENWEAAYTTICSIALQAVRQAEPNLGDRVLVLGQGIVGLLVANLLRVSGARVMVVDQLHSRRIFSEAVGAERIVTLGEQNLSDEVRAWTQGYGVDVAMVCTGSDNNTPIEQAAEALRDRGRLVEVGITRVELPWRRFYEKELEVRFSRSYGPGRYDAEYEWGGLDYPIGYVRWTEQRNFEACLHFMAEGQLELGKLTTKRAAFTQALELYQTLLSNSANEAGVVLEYEQESKGGGQESGVRSQESRSTEETAVTKEIQGQRATHLSKVTEPVSRLDVIGAGNFARTMLLPHLRDQIEFATVVNQTSLSANHAKKKFGFQKALTDPNEALADSGNQAVLIATRHHLHGPLLEQALRSHRHVFVEKPLCLSREELGKIDAALAQSRGSIQVGFNRRFAPAAVEFKKSLDAISGPKSVNYRVFAGKLDPTSWYANFTESGGRVLGEGCHFLDLFCFLLGKPVRVCAQSTWPVDGRLPFADSFAAQVEFEGGSCGQLIYSAEGDSAYPKETLTAFGLGLVAEIVNFQELKLWRNRKEKTVSFHSKGHAEELSAWVAFLRGQAEHPFPYEQSRTSMALTFTVLESLQQGRSLEVR
jgi:predicted dehydrogenase/threonine dehydrogenase-like Zn-dependent dehydrogenase